MLDTEQRAALREELTKITPGPWFWWGNTDNHSVALCGRQPGLGVCEVLSTIGVDRDPEGPEGRRLKHGLMSDCDYTEEQADKFVHEVWATDEFSDSRREDQRLALTDEGFLRHNVEDLVVYQVARAQELPEDTPRDHPKVYRADACDVRNLNGRFIAAAPQRITELLDTIDDLQAQIYELEAGLREAYPDSTVLINGA
jgi:hypothetical protein